MTISEIKFKKEKINKNKKLFERKELNRVGIEVRFWDYC